MRAWTAALMAAGVAAASLPLLAGTAQAAVAPVVSSKTLNCQTSAFAAYDWAAKLTVSATTDGTDTVVTMQSNDLPGVVPLDVASASTVGTIVAVINGTSVTLSGSGSTNIVAREPVAMPAVSAKIAGSTTPLTVEVKRLQYDVSAFGSNFPTLCPTGGGTTSWPIGDVEVETVDTLPTPTPTTPAPTATTKPTPTPTATTPADSGDKKGVAAKGTVKFACFLRTLNSPFKYEPKATMSGSRAKATDSKVSLKLNFTDIPGLAPLPIENGTMKVTAQALVGGKKVSFAETSTVNAETYGKVPVPTMTSTITTDEEKLSVEITAFKFDFGEMAGTQIYSDCTGGGKLSAMTVGVGADSEDSDDTGGSSSGSSDTLPKTGAGTPLAMIGLWSSAFVLIAVALLIVLPRRTRQTRN